jgi:hypothetical protein
MLTSELRPAWYGCCRRPVGIQTIGGWLVESGRQGRWEGLGWHIALETKMNRAVNRGRGCGWGKEGWAPRASEGPPWAGGKAGRQAERRAGFESLLKLRQSHLCSRGIREESEVSQGTWLNPGSAKQQCDGR